MTIIDTTSLWCLLWPSKQANNQVILPHIQGAALLLAILSPLTPTFQLDYTSLRLGIELYLSITSRYSSY